MLGTGRWCSASRKTRSSRPLPPRRERQARKTSSTVVQSSSVIRVSMVGSSQTDLPSVTDPRTWESTHCILSPIRPHGLAFFWTAVLYLPHLGSTYFFNGFQKGVAPRVGKVLIFSGPLAVLRRCFFTETAGKRNYPGGWAARLARGGAFGTCPALARHA